MVYLKEEIEQLLKWPELWWMRKGCQNIFGQKQYTAVHILNRCPTKALKDKTPVEASGIKPSVSHFKKFLCIFYAHVPAQKRIKLNEKRSKMCFSWL